MLPDQVGKLSRRKAANAVECCNAAASLAQVGFDNSYVFGARHY
jgi:hypothetical protein